ncbi:enoyl-CoA hydratase/isomerase family protein [Streptomyces sp. S07_1.15]|uniref:enoyl-CoA hydratase/isomerase family protein n=1 Tax=Streptomyces sp. S07_1.15 TaxID=2873925 RepID=UPI001D144322|nr:enoyl-CoA hydratase/isomerase family protein [Streptomyces sp. S07_1.15]MCC3650799.1 enoyl-CoA hydratase/isomerase family protein [Streptomyces sp. S07_1.15]
MALSPSAGSAAGTGPAAPAGTLLCDVRDGVATVTIHHPAKRNAMTAAMWRDLPVLLERLAADASVRVLVLTGSGGTFCAGADIAELSGTGVENGGGDGDGEPAGGGPQSLAVAAEEALAAFPKPTLAAVRGYCVGGGCQLAAACDLRFAAEGSSFGVTPARLGIVYPATATRRLAGLVGPATAKFLLFSAELIGADRALRTGLVDELLPPEELDGRVAEFARTLASRSLLTQAAAKEFANGDAGPERVAHWAEQARGSGDTAEGVSAFLERRPPRFTWAG